MPKLSAIQEVELLSTRAVAFVTLALTGLLSICWLTTSVPLFQAATFLSGISSILTWSSYCQQKTSAEIEQLSSRR